MIKKIARMIFGSKYERDLKNLMPYVNKINEFEPTIQKLNDEELKNKTTEFKDRLKKGETLNDIMCEAYAVVREAARRTLGERPFDEQLMGAVTMHWGNIAEMKTGEGKTLTSTMPLYLNSLEGKPCHLITVNDYLAKRDTEWMSKIYNFLGIKASYILNHMDKEDRIEAYKSDIVYGTNSSFGFDYLRDNMVRDYKLKVQRGHYFAIIDEVDSILIDEARTPLIISGPSSGSNEIYLKVNKIIKNLNPASKNEETGKWDEESGDYKHEEKDKNAILTEQGTEKVERLLGIDNLYAGRNVELIHVVNQCLRAHIVYQKDVDYIVEDGRIVIIDEFTGRKMPTRRFSDGLHSALEAKENVQLQQENQTLATITIQNYFRMYGKLAGMTGTAETEAEEFRKIYGLDVTVIPTHEPVIREDEPDRVYKKENDKFKAAVEEIAQRNQMGQPMLVGTISVEKSEKLSRMLKSRNVRHNVLNAKYHEQEAEIVKNAGQKGAVTIATNMAGRGTDIKLGKGVKEVGGLCVIGTERHESRRIDNQLRGRSGRQGDPGRSIFFLCFDDELLRLFGSERAQNMMGMLGMNEGQMVQHKMITKTIKNAQKKVEGRNYEIRKHLLEYDDVLNRQRSYVYEMRDAILLSENLTKKIDEIIYELSEDIISDSLGEGRSLSDAETEELIEWIKNNFYIDCKLIKPQSYDRAAIEELLAEEFKQALKEKQNDIGEENMINLEKIIMLRAIDEKWKSQLYNMDALRQGINWVAMAQQNPLTEYKREGMAMFSQMKYDYRKEVISTLFKVKVVTTSFEDASKTEKEPQSVTTQHNVPNKQFGNQFTQRTKNERAQDRAAGVRQKRVVGKKVGRNDPCPCGSGKKYKNCCGRN
jgi:preprotein translocase subunit SecA